MTSNRARHITKRYLQLTAAALVSGALLHWLFIGAEKYLVQDHMKITLKLPVLASLVLVLMFHLLHLRKIHWKHEKKSTNLIPTVVAFFGLALLMVGEQLLLTEFGKKTCYSCDICDYSDYLEFNNFEFKGFTIDQDSFGEYVEYKKSSGSRKFVNVNVAVVTKLTKTNDSCFALLVTHASTKVDQEMAAKTHAQKLISKCKSQLSNLDQQSVCYFSRINAPGLAENARKASKSLGTDTTTAMLFVAQTESAMRRLILIGLGLIAAYGVVLSIFIRILKRCNPKI